MPLIKLILLNSTKCSPTAIFSLCVLVESRDRYLFSISESLCGWYVAKCRNNSEGFKMAIYES